MKGEFNSLLLSFIKFKVNRNVGQQMVSSPDKFKGDEMLGVEEWLHGVAILHMEIEKFAILYICQLSKMWKCPYRITLWRIII